MNEFLFRVQPLLTPLLNSSLVNDTGLFTTLPTYSYHALQSFFNATDLINQTALEIAFKNLSACQQLQANIRLEWNKEGDFGQIELALYTGELLFGYHDRHSIIL